MVMIYKVSPSATLSTTAFEVSRLFGVGVGVVALFQIHAEPHDRLLQIRDRQRALARRGEGFQPLERRIEILRNCFVAMISASFSASFG
jgi:hypothetical protein